MAELPADLFESLLAADEDPSSKSLAAVALALRRGEARGSAERAVRAAGMCCASARVSDAYLAIVNRGCRRRAVEIVPPEYLRYARQNPENFGNSRWQTLGFPRLSG